MEGELVRATYKIYDVVNCYMSGEINEEEGRKMLYALLEEDPNNVFQAIVFLLCFARGQGKDGKA